MRVDSSGCLHTGLVRNSASEELLWSYLVQLVGAVRAASLAGLALRAGCLMPSKVLVTPHGRLHVNCLGLPDVLLGEMAGTLRQAMAKPTAVVDGALDSWWHCIAYTEVRMGCN